MAATRRPAPVGDISGTASVIEAAVETSDNIEVGYRSTFDRVSIGVTGFSNRFDDFIALTTCKAATL